MRTATAARRAQVTDRLAQFVDQLAGRGNPTLNSMLLTIISQVCPPKEYASFIFCCEIVS